MMDVVISQYHKKIESQETEEKRYPNGQLRWREYRYGEFSGMKENRFLHSVSHYKNGMFDGLSEHYDTFGNIICKITWKNSQKDGLETVWYPNGDIHYRTHYKMHRLNGITEAWYQNGILSHKHYYDKDFLDDLFKVYMGKRWKFWRWVLKGFGSCVYAYDYTENGELLDKEDKHGRRTHLTKIKHVQLQTTLNISSLNILPKEIITMVSDILYDIPYICI